MNSPNIRFFITQGCNFNCDYCYEGGYNASAVKKMDLSIIEHTLKLYENIPSYEIEFFWWEPLMNMDILFAVFHKAIGNLSITKIKINTNWFLVNDNFLEFAKKLWPKLHLVVSIDGLKESHDKYRKTNSWKSTYEQSMMNVSRLIKQWSQVSINYCILPDTVEFLENWVRNLLTLPIIWIKCMTLPEYDWDSRTYKTLIEQCFKVKILQKKFPLTRIRFNDLPDSRICHEDMTEKISIWVDGRIHTCTLSLSDFEISNREVNKNISEFNSYEDLIAFYAQFVHDAESSTVHRDAKKNDIAVCFHLQGKKFIHNARIMDWIIRKFDLL